MTTAILRRIPWGPLVLLALFLVPALGSRFYTFLANDVVIWALFATSLNLLVGYTGLVSFGHAAYFGIGAYATGLLMKKLGVPFLIAFPAAGVVAGLCALVFGFFCVRLTRIYEEAGVRFPAYREFDAAEAAGHVVITPPHAPSSSPLKSIARPRTAMITGWALDPGARFRFRCDAVFPLSDHADFADLIRFVELIQPQKVLTLHGFAEDFARTLRQRGVEAWALGRDNQLDLTLSN